MSLEEQSNRYQVRVEGYGKKLDVEAVNIVCASLEVREILRSSWGRLIWFRIEETKKMSGIEETSENAETQPEGNLGAVKMVGR